VAKLILPSRQILNPLKYEVDWGHPLARGLYLFWKFNPAGIPNELTGRFGQALTKGGSPGVASDRFGSAGVFTAANKDYYKTPNFTIPAFTGLTVLVWHKFVNNSADQLILAKHPYSAVSFYLVGETDSALLAAHSCIATNLGSAEVLTWANEISTNTWAQWAFTWSSADAYLRQYVNGKLDGSTARTGATFSDNAYELTFGGNWQDDYMYYNGRIDHCAMWDRGLSAGEILQLYAEPFAFLKEYKRRIYSVSAVQATPISVTDAAEGVDSILGVLAAIPASDSVSSTDGTPVISGTVPVTDSTTATDSPSIIALLSLADSVGATDDLVRLIFVDVLDSAGSIDSTPTISAALDLLEAISLSETVGITAILQIADIIGVTDESLVAVAMAILDSVLATDSAPTIAALIPILENIVTTETPLLGTVLQVLDAVDLTDLAWRSGDWFLISDFVDIAESVAPITAAVPVADVVQATDAIQSITVTFLLSDTVEAIDSIVAGALFIQITEALSAIDGISNISVSLPVTDVAGLTDSLSLIFQMTVTDAISAVDSIVTQLFPIVTDAIGSTDSIAGVTVALTIPDTTIASDAIAAINAVLALSETIGITDQLTINAAITITDTGTFSDDLVRINLVELLEALQAVDSIGQILVTVPVQEDITAADALGAILAVLSVADAAGMTDTMVKWDLTAGNQITSIGFVMRKRSTTFGWD